MVSFASAVQLSELTIDSPSPGTVVQVRSAQTADAALDDTTAWPKVTLGEGGTQISLAGSQPVTHVLLWITKLGGGGRRTSRRSTSCSSCGRAPDRSTGAQPSRSAARVSPNAHGGPIRAS